jgi:tRNA threonylcarbamoyladenosine biosynthesis protein TsaB
MRVVALDTATRATATALADVLAGQAPAFAVAGYREPPAGSRPGHAQELLGEIEALLQDAGGGWDKVDRIAVGIGPGTFTGLRIGVAIAQSLARAVGRPLVPVSTLHALGLGAGDLIPGAVLALIDARRGEAFAAGWHAGGDLLQPPSQPEPSVLAPEQLREHAGPGSVAVGDGAVKFRGILEQLGVFVPADDHPAHRVSAVHHCRLATICEPAPSLDAVQPSYLRLPDAEIASAR